MIQAVSTDHLSSRSDLAAADSRSLEGQLSADIISGRLAPGARLRMSAMMEQYSVGMSPLREALARLSGSGFVRLERNRGYSVAATSLEELADLANTRVRLECMAFDLAFKHGNATWEAEVMAAHHRLCCHPRQPNQLIDECWEALHRDFHLTLIGACDSPTLIGFCRNLHDLFDRYRRIAVQTAGTHPEMGGDHRMIVDAILARKAETAVAFLDRHIRDAQQEIARLWQQAESLPDASGRPTP